MNKNKPATPLNILLAIDGSKHSSAAVRLATRVAWPGGSSVLVLAVVPERLPLTGFSLDIQSMMDEALANIRRQEWATAETLATLAANKLRGADFTTEVEVCEGRPAELILERAATLAVDLIVIDARGLSGPGEFRLGSTAYKMVHHAACSVLVARPLEQTQSLRTIVATDGSLEAQRASEFLCALSPPQWTVVTVVSVAKAKVSIPADAGRAGRSSSADLPEAMRQMYDHVGETHAGELVRYLHDCGVQAQCVVCFGHPADGILTAAREQEADLIVIGSRGQTCTEPFHVGGVAQKVVKHASCSVLMVR